MSTSLDRFSTALADRYRIQQRLGEGAMATVYLAEDVKHRRKVAIKVLKPELAATLGPDRFTREIEIAAQAFQRANALNPNLSRNHYHYAWYLDLFDRLDEAIAEHERARDLDPFTPLNSAWLAQLYAKAGRFDEAVAIAEQSKKLQSVVPVGAWSLARVYEDAGRWDDAVREMEEVAAAVPQLVGLLADAYARAGREEDARTIVAALESSPPNAMSALGLARTYDALGDVERVLDWLEFEPGHVFRPWAMKEMSDSVKSRPRFRALVRLMDLEEVIPAPSSSARR